MENKFICKGKTEITIDTHVTIKENVVLGPNCKTIKIGFGSFIGENVYIDVPNLVIGEYTTIHKNCTLHGYNDMTIGHNCWIGQNSIIDSIAGTIIGNNVGIGTYSQLWTHIKFGDCLEGCQWKDEKKLIIEDDVWLVGHCIVSPITAHKKSMLLVGGVITKDMIENHIYGGCPAVDLTEKLGTQFKNKNIEEKRKEFLNLYKEFCENNKINFNIKVLDSIEQDDESYKQVTTFFLKERKYRPIRSEEEFMFIKYLLYDKAKFIPEIVEN